MAFEIQHYGVSDVGRVRASNQDRWAALPDCGFFVLADGMGGHRAGDVAATVTVDAMADFIKKNVSSIEAMAQALTFSNREVYQKSLTDPTLEGMGSTVCALWVSEDEMIYGHVGDSRIYLKREGRLEQLTEDHSLVEMLLTTGEISREEAEGFRKSHVITQAIGSQKNVEPAVNHLPIFDGDLFLLCSDGLSDCVSFAAIEAIINSCTDLKRIVERLIQAANDAGGEDNITVVVVKAHA